MNRIKNLDYNDLSPESKQEIHSIFDNGNFNRHEFSISASENLLRELKDIVHKNLWIQISCESSLSEDFIREMQDYVYWPNIFHYQSYSNEFLEEFKDRLSLYIKTDYDIQIMISNRDKWLEQKNNRI